jgi:hypothetical protein
VKTSVDETFGSQKKSSVYPTLKALFADSKVVVVADEPVCCRMVTFCGIVVFEFWLLQLIWFIKL